MNQFIRAAVLAALALGGPSCFAQAAPATAISKDERTNNPDGTVTVRALDPGDKVEMYARGLKRIELTATVDGVAYTNTGGIGLRSSTSPSSAIAEFITAPGSTPPAGAPAPFPGGIVVTQGVAMMRGWRPIVRTPRTTNIAPGSCFAVEVDKENRVDRIALLSSEALTDAGNDQQARAKAKAYSWLDTDPTQVARLDIGEFVEVRPKPGGPPGAWDFVRWPEDHAQAGQIRIFTLTASDRRRFETLIPRLDCESVRLR